eukprot:jgi/Ulvmu1/3019/UM015_0059.1
MHHVCKPRLTCAKQCLNSLFTVFKAASAQPARPLSSALTLPHAGFVRLSGASHICMWAVNSGETLKGPATKHIDAGLVTRPKRTVAVGRVIEYSGRQSSNRSVSTSDDHSSLPVKGNTNSLPYSVSEVLSVRRKRYKSCAEQRDDLTVHHMATSDWVDHVLQAISLESMDRKDLSQAFQTITKLLSIAFSSTAPAHQVPTLRRSSEQLRTTLDPQLPDALAALIARAEQMAVSTAALNAPRLHAPIALKLIADVFQVAPQPLLLSMTSRHEVADALSSLLQQCSMSQSVLRNAKHASMVFSSLVVLRQRRVYEETVNKACYCVIGRVRTSVMSKYDLAAVEGFCWLIAQSRKGSGQPVPRTWWIAMRQLEGLASLGALPFRSVAHLVESIATVGRPPEVQVQMALLQAATRAASASQQGTASVAPSAVAKFLRAAVQLDLRMPAGLPKCLFLQALRRPRQCRLDTTMSLLASLHSLNIQLNDREVKLVNQQVLRYLEGATINETLKFLNTAQQIQMQLGDRFVTAVTKSIAAGLNRGEIEESTVKEAHEALGAVTRKSMDKVNQMLDF